MLAYHKNIFSEFVDEIGGALETFSCHNQVFSACSPIRSNNIVAFLPFDQFEVRQCMK